MTQSITDRRKAIQLKAAVPTFLVADVGATARWYAETLGFRIAGTVPAREPYVYASLQRDGVELMLLGLPATRSRTLPPRALCSASSSSEACYASLPTSLCGHSLEPVAPRLPGSPASRRRCSLPQRARRPPRPRPRDCG